MAFSPRSSPGDRDSATQPTISELARLSSTTNGRMARWRFQDLALHASPSVSWKKGPSLRHNANLTRASWRCTSDRMARAIASSEDGGGEGVDDEFQSHSRHCDRALRPGPVRTLEPPVGAPVSPGSPRSDRDCGAHCRQDRRGGFPRPGFHSRSSAANSPERAHFKLVGGRQERRYLRDTHLGHFHRRCALRLASIRGIETTQ